MRRQFLDLGQILTPNHVSDARAVAVGAAEVRASNNRGTAGNQFNCFIFDLSQFAVNTTMRDFGVTEKTFISPPCEKGARIFPRTAK